MAENALYLVNNTLTSERATGAWFPSRLGDVVSGEADGRCGEFLQLDGSVFDWAPPVNSRNFTRSVDAPDTPLDFSLGKSSWLRGWGAEPPVRAGVGLAPSAEFHLPKGTSALDRPDAWTPGAFQTSDPRR
jgi:hypothetical protein